jgi:hypothetical protein
MAWAAAKARSRRKAGPGSPSDRRIVRLVAEARNSVKLLFDRTKCIGTIPPNLLRQYPALVEGSIASTPPPRRSHHAKVAPAPRVKRTRAHPKVLSISQFIEKRGQVQNDYRENVG